MSPEKTNILTSPTHTTTFAVDGHMSPVKEVSVSGSVSLEGCSDLGEKLGEDQKEAAFIRRAPDMQMGKCRYVRLLTNITYIVGSVILRTTAGKSEILLVKEMKKNCPGKYLPSGKVMPGESIEDSVAVVVKHKTGYNCEVNDLISLEVKGSGWYRFIFMCKATSESPLNEEEEKLESQWFAVDELMKMKDSIRSNDIFRILEESKAFTSTETSFPNTFPCSVVREPQRGLYIEFVITKYNMDKSKIEVLVHKSCKDQIQLLERNDILPTVEFGFEYFFPMVVSKCYRHILENGGSQIEIPTEIIEVSCEPSPVESIDHGIRVRILSPHKPSISKCPIVDQARYTWIELTDPTVLSKLRLNKGQSRPKLHML
uniref:Nudix hydrolase domain-containing protein n=1 Tax=Rhabditophanes sp. KR3021 TaxID=114890 RepID=A0AC35TQ64_9BILA